MSNAYLPVAAELLERAVDILRPGADVFGIAAGGTQVADFRTTASSVGIIPPPITGTPSANGLFAENVPKSWASIAYSGGTPTAEASFNVTSVSDDGTGLFTLSFDRALTSTSFVACVTSVGSLGIGVVNGRALGSCQIQMFDTTFNASDKSAVVLIMGKQ